MYSDYRREMDQLSPGPEAMARLEEAMRADVPTRAPHPLRFGRKAVLAAAVCMALALSAVAAGPTVWQGLQDRLGVLAPLAVPAEGVVADQGVEVRLVGSISDGYEARVYFTATDQAGGRFNEHTQVGVQLAGDWVGRGAALGKEILARNEEAQEILVEANLTGVDSSMPLTLEVYEFDSAGRTVRVEQLPRPEKPKTAPTTKLNGTTVLLPGETPEEMAEGLFLSAMGFDADGLFHIRVDYGEGYRPGDWLFVIPLSAAYPDQTYYEQGCLRTELECGVDLAYPRVTLEAWNDIQGFYVDGGYSGPETVIEGAWELPVTLEQSESRTVDLDQIVGNFRVGQVEVSQLGVVVTYERLNGEPGWLTNVRLIRTDGAVIPLEVKLGSTLTENGRTAYTRWSMEEPVENLDDLDYLMLGDVRVELN